MANRTDGEPVPRTGVSAYRRPFGLPSSVSLPRTIDRPDIGFFDVLDARRSSTGGSLPIDQLSSLLWHVMRLRNRRPGRFGIGRESRSAPSAGGLHPIKLLILPIDGLDAGAYDDHQRALTPIELSALGLNRTSIAEILAVDTGTTIQFAADAELVAACYENPESLVWRDAGALVATMCLVATALKLTATPVGRIGDAIVRAAGLPEGFIGAGAVHVGGVPIATGAGQPNLDDAKGME